MPPRLNRDLKRPLLQLTRPHTILPTRQQRQTSSSSQSADSRNPQRSADQNPSTASTSALDGKERPGQSAKEPEAPRISKGSLAPTSPFYHVIYHQRTPTGQSRGAEADVREPQTDERRRVLDRQRELADGKRSKLDPNPIARRRWERKMVIRDIVTRGYVPRDIQIKRTERQSLNKSEFWRTSMKKLQPLATQIAGKTVEEAIVQMRFSKKKVAKSVLEHLELARDQAIVERGMGLGLQTDKKAFAHSLIKLKDGTRHKITDQTGIYVDQAWVGKGKTGKTPYRKARGRIDVHKLPQTSLTVVLKEEKTRVREHMERVAKEKKKPVWVQHSDRPIDGQRQYFTW